MEEASQLMFQNHIKMVRYLSYHRDSLWFVAEYYFQKQLVVKDTNHNCQSFTLILEEGMEDYANLNKSSEKQYIKYFISKGKKELFTWLSCLIKGVLELQGMGIFHADLELRNTIKLEKRSGEITYKIIDFDRTFKIRGIPSERHTSLLEHTKAIIKFWINSDTALK